MSVAEDSISPFSVAITKYQSMDSLLRPQVCRLKVQGQGAPLTWSLGCIPLWWMSRGNSEMMMQGCKYNLVTKLALSCVTTHSLGADEGPH